MKLKNFFLRADSNKLAFFCSLFNLLSSYNDLAQDSPQQHEKISHEVFFSDNQNFRLWLQDFNLNAWVTDIFANLLHIECDF